MILAFLICSSIIGLLAFLDQLSWQLTQYASFNCVQIEFVLLRNDLKINKSKWVLLTKFLDFNPEEGGQSRYHEQLMSLMGKISYIC